MAGFKSKAKGYLGAELYKIGRVAYQRLWRSRRKKVSGCVHCKAKAVSGKTRCRKCSDVDARVHQCRRLRVIKKYGGKCACCRERREEFLTIDHTGGRGVGARHRKTRSGTNAMYGELDRGPADKSKYRVLCYNCNCSLGFRGYCPHDRE